MVHIVPCGLRLKERTHKKKKKGRCENYLSMDREKDQKRKKIDVQKIALAQEKEKNIKKEKATRKRRNEI